MKSILLLTAVFIFSHLSALATSVEKKCFSYYYNQEIECVDFSMKNMSDSDYSRVDWTGGNLEQANFENSNLESAFLIEVQAKGANFKNANLYGAKLFGADLRLTNLDGANLNGSHLENTDLSTAYVKKSTTFNGASINKKTKLPYSWGEDDGERRLEAVRRGMLTIRE